MAGDVSPVIFRGGGGECSILLFCRLARCSVIMVLCIVVRLLFIACSVMVSGFVLKIVVYLVLLKVVGFLSRPL